MRIKYAKLQPSNIQKPEQATEWQFPRIVERIFNDQWRKPFSFYPNKQAPQINFCKIHFSKIEVKKITLINLIFPAHLSPNTNLDYCQKPDITN
jgi:hypothetical protein